VFILPQEIASKVKKAEFTAERILRAQVSGENLQPSDIRVEWLPLTYAMKDVNPVERCSFFTKYEPDKIFVSAICFAWKQ
jgi:hypothetical protein